MASYLCLDQGGHSSRALVIDAQGALLAQAQCAVATRQPQPGWVEHDGIAVAASLRSAANTAIAQLDANQRRDLRAAGLVTQRASLVCWRRGDVQPLGPVLSWQDTRAADWLHAHPVPPALAAVTGLRPNAHLGASKYRWCLDHLPEVAAAAASGELAMGPLAAFLVQRLARRAPLRVDPANAARTLLWDLQRGDWSEPLLAWFGLRRDWFPGIAATLDDYGELELDHLVLPLRLLNGDQSAAALAYGWPAADCAAINIGTGAFVFAPCAAPAAAPAPLLTGIAHAGATSLYTLEGTVHGAAAALDWWAQRAGVDDYRPLLAAALQTQLEPPLFINGVGGLGAPDWRPELASVFIGGGDRDAELAAVLESIVFLLQRNLDVLRARIPLTQLQVSGGLARIDGLCHRLADLAGLPVRRYGQQEASALGAAFALAGQPALWLPARDWQEFAARPNAALRRRYEQWSAELERRLAA